MEICFLLNLTNKWTSFYRTRLPLNFYVVSLLIVIIYTSWIYITRTISKILPW